MISYTFCYLFSCRKQKLEQIKQSVSKEVSDKKLLLNLAPVRGAKKSNKVKSNGVRPKDAGNPDRTSAKSMSSRSSHDSETIVKTKPIKPLSPTKTITPPPPIPMPEIEFETPSVDKKQFSSIHSHNYLDLRSPRHSFPPFPLTSSCSLPVIPYAKQKESFTTVLKTNDKKHRVIRTPGRQYMQLPKSAQSDKECNIERPAPELIKDYSDHGNGKYSSNSATDKRRHCKNLNNNAKRDSNAVQLFSPRL